MQEDKDDVRREVQVLNLVSDHPHVAELIEVFEDARAIHLVLELCRGGELFDRVVSKGTFTERMAAGAKHCLCNPAAHHCQGPCDCWLLMLPAETSAHQCCDCEDAYSTRHAWDTCWCLLGQQVVSLPSLQVHHSPECVLSLCMAAA